MLIEFDRTKKILGQRLTQSRNNCSRGQDQFDEALELYGSLREIREHMLYDILKEKGLAVCSHPHEVDSVKHQSSQQLGIYPLNEMRLLYYERGPHDVQGEYDLIRHIRRLHLYCPEHFPQNKKWTSKSIGRFTLIESEVVVQGNKFILQVNDSDITKLIQRGGPYIEPGGMMPCFVSNAVYKHFGIPDLPKEPDFQNAE